MATQQVKHPMTDAEIEKIEQMVSEGETIVRICKTLNLEWPDVSKYLKTVDKKGMRGAKVVITNRLKSLEKQNDASARLKLAKEADKWVDYLYYAAMRLGDKVEQTRRDVDRVRRTLDG